MWPHRIQLALTFGGRECSPPQTPFDTTTSAVVVDWTLVPTIQGRTP